MARIVFNFEFYTINDRKRIYRKLTSSFDKIVTTSVPVIYWFQSEEKGIRVFTIVVNERLLQTNVLQFKDKNKYMIILILIIFTSTNSSDFFIS